jgi:calcineurin-like phosphoesterase family protein
MRSWFISDTHFGHENIIKYSNRPFANADEMDAALIANWNAAVAEDDHIYHLGDVTMRRGGRVEQAAFIRFMRRLNGHKRLLLGNHDHFPIDCYLQVFEKIYGTHRQADGILLSHFPIHPGSIGSATANVHGHIHTNPAPPPCQWMDKQQKLHTVPYINISVENTDYCPISLEALKVRIEEAKK